MAKPGDLEYMGIRDIAPLIRSRELSPVELVEHLLARIQALNPILNAFITLTPEAALLNAHRSEAQIGKGNYLGVLHGIPIAHKDIFLTADVRTTGNSRLYKNFIPTISADLVKAWAAAGAVSLGKVNTYELASGREQETFGIPRNPWDLTKVTGGSSSGSGVGLAAGLFFGASGTDGGGSIRAPAALCGVVGFRPTYGLVSTRGLLGEGWSSANCAGPMARNVDDIALLLKPLISDSQVSLDLEKRLSDPNNPGLSPLRRKELPTIGIARDFFLDPRETSEEVAYAIEQFLRCMEGAGATIREIGLAKLQHADAIYEVIALSESANRLGLFSEHDLDAVGYSVRVGIEVGRQIQSQEYLMAQQLRFEHNNVLRAAFETVDIVVGPTSSHTAEVPSIDKTRRPFPRRPVSLAGYPALSVPCGFSASGLPIGLQLIGKPKQDGYLLAFGRVVEEMLAINSQPAIDASSGLTVMSTGSPSFSVEEEVDHRLSQLRQGMQTAYSALMGKSDVSALTFLP